MVLHLYRCVHQGDFVRCNDSIKGSQSYPSLHVPFAPGIPRATVCLYWHQSKQHQLPFLVGQLPKKHSPLILKCEVESKKTTASEYDFVVCNTKVKGLSNKNIELITLTICVQTQ